ncbi:uncharacterized protein LOC132714715, partial [Ruditapes philippinarum]|uniref:uncharacterized protein LOC132714715 n=1 Tax=Ruditapes philippinarum TaxID=129788 RepID=UPI00295A8986
FKKARIRKSIITESEKKRRKRERGRKEQKTRIVIGNQYERWRRFKKEKGLLTDRAVAQHLLDKYEHSLDLASIPVAGCSKMITKYVQEAGPSKVTSTPMHAESGAARTPSVSEVSSRESSDREKEDISGVEVIVAFQEQQLPKVKVTSAGDAKLKTLRGLQTSKGQAVSSAGRKVTKKQLTDSFIDPFNLSIEISDEKDSEDEDENIDEDYQPSFCLTAVLPREVTVLADDVAFEEVEFNLEADDEELVEEAEDVENIPVEDIKIITSEQDNLWQESCCEEVVFPVPVEQKIALR